MFQKKNLVVFGLLLCLLFAGAIGWVSLLINRTVDQMHYSMVEEMGLYQAELLRQDFQKTEELADRLQEFIETEGYREEKLKEWGTLWGRLDRKISRIWFLTEGGKGFCIDSCVRTFRADTVGQRIQAGLHFEAGQYYWTLCRQCGEVVYGMDISLKQLHAYFSNMMPAGKNYAYILDETGMLLVHPEEKWLGMRSLDSLEQERTCRVRETHERIHVTDFSRFLLLPVEKVYYPLEVGTETWVVVINVVRLDTQETMAYFYRYSLGIVSITLLIFIVLLIYSQYRWRKEYHLRQKAEQEAMQLNLQQLKNQLNPHFLFNALNSLHVLIASDAATARKFVLELSKVYRYVLEKRKENLTFVREEVEFIRHYYFLQKIRFGEQLSLQLADDLDEIEAKIPVMSLQLIFENALKYNEITRQHPLFIKIYVQSGILIMENTYAPRTDVSVASFGLGIENIQEIYRYYSDFRLDYEIRGEKFIYRLPLIR